MNLNINKLGGAETCETILDRLGELEKNIEKRNALCWDLSVEKTGEKGKLQVTLFWKIFPISLSPQEVIDVYSLVLKIKALYEGWGYSSPIVFEEDPRTRNASLSTKIFYLLDSEIHSNTPKKTGLLENVVKLWVYLERDNQIMRAVSTFANQLLRLDWSV